MNMFEKKPLKTTSIQIKLTQDEKKLVGVLVEYLHKKSISDLVVSLIGDEFIRALEFEDGMKADDQELRAMIDEAGVDISAI